MSRVKEVDISKGIAIILVVYGHVILGLHSAGLWNNVNYRLQYSFIYGFHMPLFFFLSGLFIKDWIEKDQKNAMVTKANRLLRPYLIWSIVQGIIMIVLSSSTNSKNSWQLLAKIPTEPFSQFWYLYDLFFLFLIYYVVIKKFKISEMWLLVIAALIAPFAFYINFWQSFRIFYYLLFFVLGSVFWQHKEILIRMPIFVCAFVFILLNMLFFFWHTNSLITHIGGVFIALSGIALVISCAHHIQSNILSKIGQLSMPIYLIHIISLAGVRISLLKIGITNIYIHVVLGFLFGIIIPLLVYMILRKTKLNKIVF